MTKNTNIWLFFKFLISISAFTAAHIYGYIDRLQYGMPQFVGIEVAKDLVSDALLTAILASIYTGIYVVITFLLKEIFEIIKDKIQTSSNNENIIDKYIATNIHYYGVLFVVFLFLYIGIPTASSLDYLNHAPLVMLTLLLVAVAFSLNYFTKRTTVITQLAITTFMITLGFYTGELKAGQTRTGGEREIIFIDSSKIQGYVLHRVENGILFQKKNFNPFNYGTIFVPYDSIKFISEVDDYPGLEFKKTINESEYGD